MRRNLEIARSVQEATLAAEAALDGAVSAQLLLASKVFEHKDEAGLHFAHPAVTSVIDEVSGLLDSRRSFIEMHAELRKAAVQDLNLPIVGVGGSQNCPKIAEFFTTGLDRRVAETAETLAA